ncbi:YcaO-like family protein [Gammaproteobacteria bacterium]|nr:YcaO-like family protein [Gammaproteobacteria bacterium]
MTPEATMARIDPLKDRLGITRVANVTGLDSIGIPVVMVCRPNSRSVAVSQGKGLDLISAKVSGLMESIETWHGENISLPLKFGSFNDLDDNTSLLDIDLMPSIQDSRYHPDLPMLWIEGRNFCTDKTVWIPFEVVHCNYTFPHPPGHGCFSASTNGLASGNHIIEAQCHAICEVIERDSTTLWRNLSQRKRMEALVDLDTVDDVDCRNIIQALHGSDVAVSVWDTTTDVGAPSFYCMILGRGVGVHLGAGAGCHPSKHIALLRTLTEAIQTRNTYIAGSRDDLSPDEYTRAGIMQKYREAEKNMRNDRPGKEFQSIPSKLFDTFEQDLDWLLQRLGSIGIHTVVTVDLTKPQLGVPVVRVIIPELELPDDEDDYLPGRRALKIAESAT